MVMGVFFSIFSSVFTGSQWGEAAAFGGIPTTSGDFDGQSVGLDKKLQKASFSPLKEEDENAQKEWASLKKVDETATGYFPKKWDAVLKEANREEIANFLNMLTGDYYFALLFLLDSIAVDAVGNEKLLDETVIFLDYPLSPEWARTLYQKHQERVLKKEPHFWVQALTRLMRDLEEDFIFSTPVMPLPASKTVL